MESHIHRHIHIASCLTLEICGVQYAGKAFKHGLNLCRRTVTVNWSSKAFCWNVQLQQRGRSDLFQCPLERAPLPSLKLTANLPFCAILRHLMPSYSTFFEASEPHPEKAPNTKITCDKNKQTKTQNTKINHTHWFCQSFLPRYLRLLGCFQFSRGNDRGWRVMELPCEAWRYSCGEAWPGRIGVFFSEMEPIWTQLQRKYSGGLVSKGGVFFVFGVDIFCLPTVCLPFLFTYSYQVFSCSGSFYLPNCSGKRVPDPWQWLNKDF